LRPAKKVHRVRESKLKGGWSPKGSGVSPNLREEEKGGSRPGLLIEKNKNKFDNARVAYKSRYCEDWAHKNWHRFNAKGT